MFRKLLERLRGSSRAADDLAVGTTRPGDFIEPDDGEQPVVPNPHEEDERPKE